MTHALTLRIDDALWREIRAEAYDRIIPMSEVIRERLMTRRPAVSPDEPTDEEFAEDNADWHRVSPDEPKVGARDSNSEHEANAVFDAAASTHDAPDVANYTNTDCPDPTADEPKPADPNTVTTVDELFALPLDSVVVDFAGVPRTKRAGNSHMPGGWTHAGNSPLTATELADGHPMTVVYRGRSHYPKDGK